VLAQRVHNAISIGGVDEIDDEAGAALLHAQVVILHADMVEHQIEAHHRVGSDRNAQL
jgi:hypothetical protein